MNPRHETESNWHLLFFVTAGSFFIFSAFIKLLDASTTHVFLFFKIGLVSLGLGVAAMLREWALSANERK